MTIQTAKLLACRSMVLALCGLTLPLLAQQRTGGGGFGGAARTAGTAASSSTGATTVDRPANGQVGPANFYVDPDSGVVGDGDAIARALTLLADSIEGIRDQPVSILEAAGVFRRLSIKIRKRSGMSSKVLNDEQRKLRLLRRRLEEMGVASTGFERLIAPEGNMASDLKKLCEKAKTVAAFGSRVAPE